VQKRYLLAPGPTAIPREVLFTMAEPILHHRNPLFGAVVAEVRVGYKFQMAVGVTRALDVLTEL